MENKERCEEIISFFNGRIIPGCKEALLVKFADGGNKKKPPYKNGQDGRSLGQGMGGPGGMGGGAGAGGMGGGSGSWRDGDLISAYEAMAAANPLTMMGTTQLSPFAPQHHRGGYATGPTASAAGMSPATTGYGPMGQQPTGWMHPSAGPPPHPAPYLLAGHAPAMGGMLPPMEPSPNPSIHYSALMPQIAAQMSQMSLSQPSVSFIFSFYIRFETINLCYI